MILTRQQIDFIFIKKKIIEGMIYISFYRNIRGKPHKASLLELVCS